MNIWWVKLHELCLLSSCGCCITVSWSHWLGVIMAYWTCYGILSALLCGSIPRVRWCWILHLWASCAWEIDISRAYWHMNIPLMNSGWFFILSCRSCPAVLRACWMWGARVCWITVFAWMISDCFPTNICTEWAGIGSAWSQRNPVAGIIWDGWTFLPYLGRIWGRNYGEISWMKWR